MGIINWIDKELREVKADPLYRYYFDGIRMGEDDGVSYLLNASEGINMVLSDQSYVRSVHLFSGNDYNCNSFDGSIPFELTFRMSRHVINRKFGHPDRKGGGYTDFLGFLPAWDKYFLENCSLYVQYSIDQKNIELMAIASVGMESYLDIGLPGSVYNTLRIGKPAHLNLSQYW